MDLIAHYESSSSGSSDRDDDHHHTGRVTLCPLVSDLPLVRTQPHITGNWAGHVFLSLASHFADDTSTRESVQKFVRRAEQSGYSGHGAIHEDFHLSLSRIFYLQQCNLERFVERLKVTLQLPTIRPFSLSIVKQPLLLHNNENTRSFLAWPVEGSPQLQALVNQINLVMDVYGFPRFYHPPIFHVSVASFVPKLVVNLSSSSLVEPPEVEHFVVEAVTCKLGDRVWEIPL